MKKAKRVLLIIAMSICLIFALLPPFLPIFRALGDYFDKMKMKKLLLTIMLFISIAAAGQEYSQFSNEYPEYQNWRKYRKIPDSICEVRGHVFKLVLSTYNGLYRDFRIAEAKRNGVWREQYMLPEDTTKYILIDRADSSYIVRKVEVPPKRCYRCMRPIFDSTTKAKYIYVETIWRKQK